MSDNKERINELIKYFDVIPYYQRLYIIQFIYYRKRFYILSNSNILNEKRQKLTRKQYIKILYGYFKQDRFRKLFLIHKKISFYDISFYGRITLEQFLPIKQLHTLVTLLQKNSRLTLGKYKSNFEKVVLMNYDIQQLSDVFFHCSGIKHLTLYSSEGNFDIKEKELIEKLRNLNTLKFRSEVGGKGLERVFLPGSRIKNVCICLKDFSSFENFPDFSNCVSLEIEEMSLSHAEVVELFENLNFLYYFSVGWINLDSFRYIMSLNNIRKFKCGELLKLDELCEFKDFVNDRLSDLEVINCEMISDNLRSILKCLIGLNKLNLINVKDTNDTNFEFILSLKQLNCLVINKIYKEFDFGMLDSLQTLISYDITPHLNKNLKYLYLNYSMPEIIPTSFVEEIYLVWNGVLKRLFEMKECNIIELSFEYDSFYPGVDIIDLHKRNKDKLEEIKKSKYLKSIRRIFFLSELIFYRPFEKC